MEVASVAWKWAFRAVRDRAPGAPFRLTNAGKKWTKLREVIGNPVKSNPMRLAPILITAMFLSLGAGAAVAQPTGEFLCSLGPNDGDPCEAFSDCEGGVCIIAQGVCSDGQICVCPGGGECVSTPACSGSPQFGTCAGGVADTLCCDTDFNCAPGDPCLATHKLCQSGELQGFPCTNNAQCGGAPCASNGFFCSGGSLDGYGCVTDDDCSGGGVCDTSFVVVPTATRTPVTPGATVPPATPTQPGSTPRPTNTTGPIPTVPTNVIPATPTSPPVNTSTPVPPTPTFTPVIGTLVTTVGDAEAGANKITVNVDPTQFPVEGVVDVGTGELIHFTRRRSSTILDLKAVNGLPFALDAGSVVRVVEYTPTPGPVIIIDEGVDRGSDCAIRTNPAARGFGGLSVLGLGVLALLIRRRK